MEKNNNGNVLQELIVSLDKMDTENNIVEVNSMYGVFLSKDNKFLVCKEDKIRQDNDFCLKEFFTNEYIGSSEVRLYERIYPWRRGRYYSWHFLEMAFSVPLVDLLGKFSVNEVVTEKDIACLYANVNKYIGENSSFIEQLFNNENEKVR